VATADYFGFMAGRPDNQLTPAMPAVKVNPSSGPWSIWAFEQRAFRDQGRFQKRSR
jgi:hypothetical protein